MYHVNVYHHIYIYIYTYIYIYIYHIYIYISYIYISYIYISYIYIRIYIYIYPFITFQDRSLSGCGLDSVLRRASAAQKPMVSVEMVESNQFNRTVTAGKSHAHYPHYAMKIMKYPPETLVWYWIHSFWGAFKKVAILCYFMVFHGILMYFI